MTCLFACSGPDGKDSWLPAHDKLTKKWTMPFVMQPINTRVVRRSNALLGNLYGKHPHSLVWAPAAATIEPTAGYIHCIQLDQALQYVLPWQKEFSRGPCEYSRS